jgi:hypothetical protein
MQPAVMADPVVEELPELRPMIRLEMPEEKG